jgi:hypothetical protein
LHAEGAHNYVDRYRTCSGDALFTDSMQLLRTEKITAQMTADFAAAFEALAEAPESVGVVGVRALKPRAAWL